MSEGRAERVMSIFLEACALAGDERAEFLARVCGDEPELRAEVESLLGAHDRAGEFMGEPTVAPAASVLTPEQQKRVEDLFQRLAGLPAGQQQSLLSQLCPDDERIRAEVARLLRADSGATRGVSVKVRAALEGIEDVPDPLVGRSIGPYKLMTVLGEGGFGVVWLAERQAPYSQRVALKLIKPGMDSKAVLVRFEQERQALAVMDHPSIAKVLDGGVTGPDLGGRPYFVMEYVKGEPITTYCDRNKLSVRDRLRLFIRVCDAVQHAHQKGIIHRDLKPSNVLVVAGAAGAPGGAGEGAEAPGAVPKIIDFGIAKAVSHIATGVTIFTEQGQILGTPEYMSPEQAEMGATDIDTRTDVYSLGVLLYQLLTGLLPFDPASLRSAGYAEIQRIIREVDPPKPSTRMQSSGDTGTALAAQRRLETNTLTRTLRGDLDWIVMKCLEKDRTRRYDSAGSLWQDVERFLTDKPVTAGPPSRRYVAAKFVRRNKGPVVAAAALLTVLVAGIIGTTIGLLGESAQRKKAEEAAGKERDARLEADRDKKDAVVAREKAESESYVANLMAADAGLASGEPVATQRRLAAAPERFRGWEWRHLSARADRSLAVLTGHDGPVVAVVALGSSPRVASGGDDGKVRVWDLSAPDPSTPGPMVHDLGDPVTVLGATPDGSRVVAGGKTGKVRFWTTGPVAETRETTGHAGEVWSLAVSPDGRLIATGGKDNIVRLWDAATGEARFELRGHTVQARSVAFSPDGSMLASGGAEVPFYVWSTSTGERLTKLDAMNQQIWALRFSLDGRRIVVCDFLWLRVFDVQAGTELTASRDMFIGGRRIDFNAGGSRILVSGFDQGQPGSFAMGLFDGQTAKQVAPLKGHKGEVTASFFSSDGKTIFSSGADATIRRWDATTGEEQVVLRGHLRPVRGLCALADQRIVSASDDGTLRVWDPNSGPDIPSIKNRLGPISFSHLACSPDGSRIFVGCGTGDDAVHVFDPELREIAVLRGSAEGSPSELAVSRDGRRLAIVWGRSPTLFLWDLDSAKPAGSITVPAPVILSLCFSPDGAHLAVGANERSVRLFSLETFQQVRVMPGHDHVVNDLAYSADGTLLASASGDQTVRLWDAASGAEAGVLRGHQDWAISLAWSPKAPILASGSEDKTIRIWDGRSAQLLKVLRGHGGNVWHMSFSPDGSRLASGSFDGITRVWDTDTWNELLVLRGDDKRLMGLAFSPDGTSLVACGNLLRVFTSRMEPDRLAGRRAAFEVEESARALLTKLTAASSEVSLPDRIRGEASAPLPVRLAALNQHLGAIGRNNEEATMTAFKTSLARYILIDDAIASVNADTTLEPHVRDAAVRLLRNDRDAPGRLFNAAWEIVRKPDRSPERYALALRAAESGIKNHAPHGEYFRRYGVTLYRNGRYEEAITAFKRAIELSGRNKTALEATDKAFIAMSEYRLGRTDEARAGLDSLKELMKKPEFASDEQAKWALQEAEALISTQ